MHPSLIFNSFERQEKEGKKKKRKKECLKYVEIENKVDSQNYSFSFASLKVRGCCV